MYDDSGTMQTRGDRVEVFGYDLAGVGEALAVRVGLAVVDDGNVEAGNRCDLVHVVRDVSRTEDVEQRRRQHGLDEDLQRAAADQAGIVLGIVVQIEGERTRLLLLP